MWGRVKYPLGVLLLMVSITSGLEENTSGLEENTSGLEENTSGLEETTSRIEETTSRIEETTSRIEEATLGIEKIKPGHAVMTYDFLYKEGVSAYLAEEWEKCIRYFELSLADWHWWKDNVARCRRTCSKESAKSELFSEKLSEDERFYERAVRNTLCVVNCKKSAFGSRMDRIIEGVMKENFELRKPYDYLQLCYFKMDKLKEAADAAATVLAVEPNHEVMKTNLKYYLAEGNFAASEVNNLELQEYGKEYIKGNVAYNNGDYKATVAHMEKSLALFYDAFEVCHHLCDNPFDQGWFPDFIASLANHYTFTLRCKRRCSWRLSNLFGEIMDDFFSSYFNYLQYSYYQVGDVKKACEAVETALAVNPNDEVQIRNKQFYVTEEGVKDDYFIPRKNAVAFMKIQEFEEQLMQFIDTSFISVNDDAFLDEDDDDIEMGIRVVQTEKELGGEGRMVADGFATPIECLVLTELTKIAAIEGDGYKQNSSPHTQSEYFQGVTLGRAGLMVHAKLIAEEALDLIIDITNHCRDYMERYFNLKEPLYFDFTHLVCRTAKPEMSVNRSLTDLSHEVHVDNCILQDSGECLRIPPAYTYRDYSALLYLNDEFEGGDFIFTHDRSGLSHEAIVQPTCGRMIGFTSGPENPHGVLPVLDGSRCAIGMWFTHDKRYRELERKLAETLLERIKDKNI
ncbi:prolyl 3-hydroxylase 1-like isoform X2 [Homarus americanus]|uniref:prolyl 3-hydroxylase 1-like isoform X2 n=1 Tax=Homarus americanus TaxID=6706 RepID=UPI001C459A20|nr:prolyl 3-hydroxylase 1-like isoform X2 [Homarus americanus]